MTARTCCLVIVLISVSAVATACGVLPTNPTVSNIRMTTDDSGKTTTNSYAPGDAIYVFADLNGLAAGSILEARWYAVNAAGLAANSHLSSADYAYKSGISYIYFELTTTDGSDWPIGSYRVELYLDGAKVGEQGFTVQ